MSRLVEPRRYALTLAKAGEPGDASSVVPDTIKDYGERVAKYIPGEVLAFYTASISLISSVDKAQTSRRLWLFGIVGIFFLIVTPLWLGRFTKHRSVKRTNQLMGMVAFGVWAYAFPAGWFYDRALHDPIIAGLLMIGFTVISAFITPKA